MVTKCHRGGEEFKYDRGVDEVDLVPHAVGDPIGARGGGGGEFGEGEFDVFLSEGVSGRVSL